MADWSQLPPELLLVIGKRLEARFDVVRLRSVCSSWRSSVPPKVNPYLVPMYLPSAYGCGYGSDHYRIPITRYTFYLVRLSHGDQTKAPACWFVRIRHGNDRVKIQLWDPFFNSELKPLPENFPKVLDLANFQVFELDHVYIGQFYADIGHPLASIEREFTTKLLFQRSCRTTRDDFMILTRFWCLAVLRPGEKWKFFENVRDVDDTIYFNGKFYVVDREGRTIVIDQSLNLIFIGCVGSGRRRARKFLVKSVDNLLAVEKLFSTDREDPIILEDNEVAGFNVFKMNEEEQRWDEMESLRDQILFLCFHGAISASAFEFGWGRGNLIFFSGYTQSGHRRMFVFDLETGTASPLENCPDYSNLFWPPPQWVASPELVIRSTQVITNPTHSVTSTSPKTEYKYPESGSAISTAASSTGKEEDSEHPSQVSKCSFKFCCF